MSNPDGERVPDSDVVYIKMTDQQLYDMLHVHMREIFLKYLRAIAISAGIGGFFGVYTFLVKVFL